MKLTGRNVVNGSLTGKDIKKTSVPLDRLRGGVPKGDPGPKGDTGARGVRGPAGLADPSRFVSAAGLYQVTVGPGAWQSLNPDLKRSNVFGAWVSTTTNESTTLMLDPALPATIGGKALRLHAVTRCWDATANVMISGVVISTYRENAAAAVTDVVEQEDRDDHNEAICKRYEFDRAL